MKTDLLPNNLVVPVNDSEHKQFALDILQGLSKKLKSIPSKYFYDAEGSRLFQQIMGLPEYYLTLAETEILSSQHNKIIPAFASSTPFTLVDLGAGDAAKTKILLKPLLNKQLNFTYTPVDISDAAMQELTRNLQQELPDLVTHPITGEYFQALAQVQDESTIRKVILFLGSNIGNFSYPEIIIFMKKLRQFLNPGDQAFIGFDLKKDPRLIRQAYDDAAGVTAAFNFNLLNRINKTFAGNINPDNFQHFAEYEPVSGEMKSFLVSTCSQEISLQSLDFSFHLDAWEVIQTESSYKFSESQIQELAAETGYQMQMVFTDKQRYFADVLFQII